MPNPDWGFSEAPSADVTVSKLGDGYEVRTPKGLNHVRDDFKPIWSDMNPVDGQAVVDYLKPRLGWKALKWLHPVRKTQVQVVAESVSLEYDQWNNAVLNISFRQDFNPV